MQLSLVRRRYRSFGRYRQIISVLAKYGFAEVLWRMHLVPRLRLRGLVGKLAPATLTAPQRLRMALEELGPTFVKLGQVLSTRSFLLPPDYIEELSRLQDQTVPLPFEELRPVLQDALGTRVEDCFEGFDRTPLASASIAQAHRARLRGGQEVVVKIQRPGIRSVIERDIAILQDLATLAERHLPETRRFAPRSLVDELARTLHRELDFMNEARNAEILARNFRDSPTVHIPKVFWECTSSRVMTTEYVEGIKITDVARLEAAGIDVRTVVENGARFVFKQIFEDGFFHADPHPGNLFIDREGKIVPVDFGIMGRLDESLKMVLADLTVATYKQDAAALVNVLIDLGALDESQDLPSLRYDLGELVDRYYAVPLSQIDVKEVVREAVAFVNRYDIRLPPNLALLIKTLGTYEDVTRCIDPDFNYITEIRPYVRSLIQSRLEPGRVAYDLSKTLKDAYHLVQSFPRELQLLLRRLRRGTLIMQMEHVGLERLILELDRSSNRLAFALIIAAIVVGSSFIMQLDRGPMLFGFPALGVVGYLIAGVLGLWLALAILRSGKL